MQTVDIAMTKKNRTTRLAVVGVLIVGATFLAMHANGPTEVCVREQSQILVGNMYKNVPERARYAAQVLCDRNENVPTAALFR